ncbi:hypothetical protein RISK_002759 [Rhodopirellula islandica]|uniref:Uncharacterized protein n=1 Tax=Rhodopirellula islandica TaxID=595434 RepID=A0A0J1BFA4_RHOIS|nr:hypothetical protein RISK_002759 [Rhodopirellula islandica]
MFFAPVGCIQQVGRNDRTQSCEPFGRSPRLGVGSTTLTETVQMPKDSCRQQTTCQVLKLRFP